MTATFDALLDLTRTVHDGVVAIAPIGADELPRAMLCVIIRQADGELGMSNVEIDDHYWSHPPAEVLHALNADTLPWPDSIPKDARFGGLLLSIEAWALMTRLDDPLAMAQADELGRRRMVHTHPDKTSMRMTIACNPADEWVHIMSFQDRETEVQTSVTAQTRYHHYRTWQESTVPRALQACVHRLAAEWLEE